MTPAELVALMADAAREFDGLYRALGRPDATRYADLSARLRTAADELAGVGEDTARLDWLENEMNREQELLKSGNPFGPMVSLFRRNEPITRNAIDAARAAGEG